VRELENVIERAVALAEGEHLTPEDLPAQVRERRSSDVLAGALARGLTLAELEREYISRVLQAEGGNKTRAAQRLGLDRKTLYRKLEEYQRSGSGDTPIDPHVIAESDHEMSGPHDLDQSEHTAEIPRTESTMPIPRVDPSTDDAD
jgi:hypothetical protein